MAAGRVWSGQPHLSVGQRFGNADTNKHHEPGGNSSQIIIILGEGKNNGKDRIR